MGKEVSGTPVETRQGVTAYSNFLQSLMKPGGFQQLGTDSLMALLANPMIASMLINPADRTAGLFASMVPFEKQQTAEQVAGVRSIFGSAGGRFGTGVAAAEAKTRGTLADTFARAREEALLTAMGQNQNFMGNLLQTSSQNAALPLNAMSQFFQAGAPQFQQGILPGLLSAATSIYMGKSLFGNQTPQTTGTTGGSALPFFNMYQPRIAPIPQVPLTPVQPVSIYGWGR